MADVLLFPTVNPSMVDPPVENKADTHNVILGLEHEVMELQHVVVDQALQLYHRIKGRTPSEQWTRYRIAVALLLAFAAGWMAEDPLSTFFHYKLHATAPLPAKDVRWSGTGEVAVVPADFMRGI